MVVGAAIVVGVAAVMLLIFRQTGVYLEAVNPVGAALFTFIGLTAIKFLRSEQEKGEVRSAFSRYVSPHVVSDLLANPEKLQLGGEKKELTAVFTDVKGFSTISEVLDATELVRLLNEYLTMMSDIILDLGGTVDKYEGDAIIAFFGAPLDVPEHAERACRAAVRIRRAEKMLNEHVLEEKLAPSPLLTRIGINTGPMVVGNMGTPQKMNYTIMGNAVNLAARLEGVNKRYGTWVMMSDATAEKGGRDFFMRKLDRVRVVGINTPVRLYELIDEKDAVDKTVAEAVEVFHEGLEDFEAKKWKIAAATFRRVLQILPGDTTSDVYIKQCQLFMENRPRKTGTASSSWRLSRDAFSCPRPHRAVPLMKREAPMSEVAAGVLRLRGWKERDQAQRPTRMVRSPCRPQGDAGFYAAKELPRHHQRGPVARADGSPRIFRGGDDVLTLVHPAVLCLWPGLWELQRAVARVPPRHRVPHTRPERDRFFPRVHDGFPRHGFYALEPRDAPLLHHRHRGGSRVHAPRPVKIWKSWPSCCTCPAASSSSGLLVLHSLGIPAKERRRVVPESDYQKMFWNARAVLLVNLAAIALSIVLHSWLPILLFTLPRFYGAALLFIFALTQHAGLAENANDHRLVARTVIMNPVFSFLYMHMQYHVEHHIFPLVPFHALGKLHRAVRDQMPAPYKGLVGAYSEMIPTLLRQRYDVNYYVRRDPALTNLL